MKTKETWNTALDKATEVRWAKAEERHRIMKKLLEVHDRKFHLGVISLKESKEILSVLDEVIMEDHSVPERL